MHARIRLSLAAVAALSFLVFGVLTREVDARIEIDNDVTIDWMEQAGVVSASVIGAPRLVHEWQTVRIDVAFLSGALDTTVDSELHVSIYSLDLCPPPTSICPLVFATQTFTMIPEDGFPLGEFQARSGKLSAVTLPKPGILVVSGRLRGKLFQGAPTAEITVSGDGDPIIIDRAGDDDHFHVGDPTDIPTRSVEVVRALNQIEESLFLTQAVELDAAGSRGATTAVGWTHPFMPEVGARHSGKLKTAMLSFRLLSGDPCSSNDIILLDRAVRFAATRRRPRLPVVFLRDLQKHAPNSGCPAAQVPSGEYDFLLDFASVPVRFLSPDDPFPTSPDVVDLTKDLDDGRLDVIVVGGSRVDFSDLRITLNELAAN